MADIHTGGCLYGGVRYKATSPLRSVITCHCTQCRKTSGHHTAMTSVPRANLIFESEEALVWFKSSDIARRGFCGRCGGNLL